MIDPFDAFGQTMVNNLRDRGCDLLGIEQCPTLQSQIDRMAACLGSGSSQDTGQNAAENIDGEAQDTQMAQQQEMKTEVECYTMHNVYQGKLDAAERARIEKIEIFDEFEEWMML